MGGKTLGRRARHALALSCTLFALPVAGAAAAPAFPDLVADSPGPPSAPTVYDDGGGPRLLIRFDGYVHNRGPGALEIRASGRSGTTMTDVRQRVYDGGGGPFQDLLASPAPQVIFETDDDHDHWHLKHIARYSLWNAEGTAEVAPAQKVGFCLVDSQRIEGAGSAVYTLSRNRFCEQENPTASSLTMGVSAGWRDIYPRQLAFQWVDVSDVAPGTYRLRAEIDPEGTILEANDVNPPAFGAGPAVVPGYRASSLSVPGAQGPRQIQLEAANVGGVTRAAQFMIVSAPQHGSLDRPVGQWFDGAAVRYTPNPGYSGPDSFSFAARDPASIYPRNPPPAVAILQGTGGALVTIAGAPASLHTGASAQLGAVVQNGSPEVTWRVDGLPGGSPAVGTISPSGLYRAPDRVPPAGQVRVSAESASGGSGDAVIRIVEAPAPRPAPDVPGAAPDVPGAVLGTRDRSNPLSRLRFDRHGRRLLLSLRSAKAGLVVVRAYRDGRRIGQCRARVAPKQRMTCSISLHRLRRPRAARLRVSAALYVKGKKRAVRRAGVPR